MTGLGIQQTNRRMCRYVFVMFIFLCRPRDVYVQGFPSVSCEAGEVTVGERATITCVFPTGSITPRNSDFIVKKFTASGPKDGTDIMECFHEISSTSEIPKCTFHNKSLGYNFTFMLGNDRQTVIIPSAEHSDAGQYGCDRIRHRVTRCNLTVTEMTTTTAPVTTVRTDEGDPTPAPGLRSGSIAGIVIGIIVAVGLGVGFAVWWFKFRKPTQPIDEITLILTMLKENYPQKAWIWAYDDRSATAQNGEAVVYIKYPDRERQKETVPKGLHCTNYFADVEALVHAANILSGTADNAQIVFLTDAISVLEAAAANKLPHLQEALQNIKCTRLVLQWIPSYCVINSYYEELVRKEEQDENEDSRFSVNIQLQRPQDSCHQLSKQEIIFLQRIRHNRLIFHSSGCFKRESSLWYPYEEAPLNIEQDCKNLNLMREEMAAVVLTARETVRV